MQIRCRCGHQADYKQFMVAEPTEAQRRRFAYQAGRELKTAQKWNCPACGLLLQIIASAQRESLVVVLREAK